jgi:hypothetical protein
VQLGLPCKLVWKMFCTNRKPSWPTRYSQALCWLCVIASLPFNSRTK